jgi:hypothetical protein
VLLVAARTRLLGEQRQGPRGVVRPYPELLLPVLAAPHLHQPEMFQVPKAAGHLRRSLPADAREERRSSLEIRGGRPWSSGCVQMVHVRGIVLAHRLRLALGAVQPGHVLIAVVTQRRDARAELIGHRAPFPAGAEVRVDA